MKIFVNNKGDTIVEVLIAIAIVSLILAGAYTTTNHNLNATQQAQEHSTALKIAEGQLEMLRAVSGDDPIYTYSNVFCMSAGAPTDSISGTPVDSIPSNSSDPLVYTPNCSVVNGITYYQAIERKPGSLPKEYIFTVHVRWPNIFGDGNDEVSLSYKLDH